MFPTLSPPTSSSRIVRIAYFLMMTLLSMGTYPVWFLIRSGSRYHQEAVCLRAKHIENPNAHPSSWPWILAEWRAFGSLLVTAVTILFVGAILCLPIAYNPRASSLARLLLVGVMVCPQMFILVSFLNLLWHTFYPERAVNYACRRYTAFRQRSRDRLTTTIARRMARKTTGARCKDLRHKGMSHV